MQAGTDRVRGPIGGIAFAGCTCGRRRPSIALRQRISPAPDYPQDETPRAIPRTLPRARTQRDEVDEIVAKSKAVAAQQQRPVARAVAAPLPTAPREVDAAELDRVLDKISLGGLASLTAAERAVLDETAKRLRGEGP